MSQDAERLWLRTKADLSALGAPAAHASIIPAIVGSPFARNDVPRVLRTARAFGQVTSRRLPLCVPREERPPQFSDNTLLTHEWRLNPASRGSSGKASMQTTRAWNRRIPTTVARRGRRTGLRGRVSAKVAGPSTSRRPQRVHGGKGIGKLDSARELQELPGRRRVHCCCGFRDFLIVSLSFRISSSDRRRDFSERDRCAVVARL